MPGTYSSEPPLTGLTVSEGTLTPTFHSRRLSYTVPDIANATNRITITPTAKNGHLVEFGEGDVDNGGTQFILSLCPLSVYVQPCSVGYPGNPGEGPLNDADADIPGFQVDLDEGETRVVIIRVYRGTGYLGDFYYLTLTRAASSSDDATLSGLTLSGVDFGTFDPATADYTASVDNGVIETMVTPTANDSSATYVVHLDGVVDADGVIPLAVGTSVITVEVTAGDGQTTRTYTVNVTRAAPLNTPATGAPTISGTSQVGETLTADVSSIADGDGLDNAAFTYQWLADDVDISGATGSSYTLAESDGGKAVKVRVSFTDDAGNPETRTSTQTAPIEGQANGQEGNSPATGLPTISGTAQVGETLTAGITGIADADGLSGETFTYQWVSGDGTTDTDIEKATDSTYTLAEADQGKAIKVRVTFTDGGGNEETLTSAQTATVEARSNSAGICDRTERVRDNIIGLLNAQDLGSLGIKDCSEVTDEQLTRIRFLDLAGGGTGGKITSLKSGDFEGLSGLRELNLEDNSLSKLPEGVFDGISSLELLTMQGNDLSSLPDGVFDDLNLHTLALYDNDLAALPDGVFDGLTKLSTLAISDNKLTALSGDVFTGLGGLTSLVASNNRLTSLPDGVFSGMSKLQSVSFSGNPSAPFTLPAELERRGEDGVVVKASEGAPFAMTVTLSAEGGTLSATTVVIGGGDTESAVLTVTPEGAGAVTVSVDSAAFPDAGTVHDGIQTGVGGSLTLETVASGICDRTAQVRDAILARLDNVSDCANVTDTDLSYLLLTLDLENSGITTLKSGDFDGLSRLNGINMSRNNLSALPDGVFDGLSRLQIINMNHNNLSALPDGVFDDLSRLFSIKLRRNNLSTLPDGVFSDLGDLQVLYLDANHLSELPAGVFDDLTNLFYLNLGQNGLSELPAGVFDELSNLVHLYLSFNNNPNPAVYPENTLDEDDLSAGVLGNLSKLRKLSLSDNNLSVLPDGLFTGLPSLVNVDLIGNPGATFTVTAELKQNGDAVVIKVTQGAPFDMLVTLSAEGGTLATTTVTVEGGSDSSGPVTVTPTGEGGTPVTVSVESVTFQNYQPEHTRGIQAGTGTSLTLNTPATDPVASASNNPATGLPTISGTAQVGETLTAGITGIADADGLSGESFIYQWVSGDGTTDTDIEDATGSTYKLVAADQGRSVKVRVSFTDGGGNEETLTSAPTEPVLGDGPPGAPRNLNAAPGNKEVTLSWDPPADNGNAPATGYRIEWRIDGKDYDENLWGTARSTTYKTNDQANLANGVKYFFRVRAGNGSGNSYGPYGPSSGEVSATPTSGSAVDLGTPVLSDTETLHHGMVRLDWEDVEDAGWYVVQYYHVKGGEWLDLPAVGVDIAFHGSSAVVSDLHGLSWLRVGAMSCAGASEWSQIEQLFGTNASDWKDVPVPEVEEGDEIEPCPVVLGTPVLSDTETLHHGMVKLDWQDIEDAGWYVVQYYHVKGGEWLDLPAEGVDIAFHGSSAVVSNLHGLSWLRVGAMSCAGASEWSQIEQLFGTNASDWEGVPVPDVAEGDEIEPCSEDADTPDNSPATGAPTVSGTARVGETLDADTSGIADEDGLTNAAYSFQWLADNTEIAGATSFTYTLVAEDEGKVIKVEVSFTDDAGNGETLTSGATDAVAADPTPNSPATGVPAITGTVQVGETLTADTSGIADAEGIGNVQYQYQWLADDADISGATNATYTLADTDEGKAIKVQVSFTDDASNEETLTSAATDAVATAPTPNIPATGTPTISGTAQVGEALTADTSGIADADGLGNVQYEYQWLADDTGIAGAAGSTYTVAAADEGKAIKVEVSFTDDVGNDESLTSAATDAVAARPNSLATGAPTITGTAQVGETLTADTSGISDADGLSNVQYEYQWLADDAEIAGAAGSTHTLAAADEGKAIKVEVSFADDAGNAETLTSPATDAVVAEPLEPPAKPTGLTGTASHDSVTLTWDDPQDESITGYAILRRIPGVDPDGQFRELVADTGTTATTHTDDTVKSETRYTYRIKAINGAGTSERSRWFHIDTPASPAPEPANSPATGAPTISGTAQVGETLTANTSGIADADGLGSVQYEHQWLADDAEIAGAAGSTYTVAAADKGKAIKVEVSFTDDAGNDEALTSAATDAVAARPNSFATGAPTISGTAQVGETLTADTSGIADADGLGNVQYEYQWLADDADISGATNTTYTPVAADEGQAIRVRVSFTDDEGNDESLTSAATAAVAAAEPAEPPAKPRGLSATATHDSVTLTWDDPGDDSITGYVILRRVRVNDTGGDFSVLVADTGSAATTYTDDTVAAETRYTYRIKAINQYGASERSRWFHVDTPAAP